MKKIQSGLMLSVILAFILEVSALGALLPGQENGKPAMLAEPAIRNNRANKLKTAHLRDKRIAWLTAKKQGWQSHGQTDKQLFQLMAIRGKRVYMVATTNVNAAISTAADQIRNIAPYNLNGNGITIGIWDGGAVRSTHQEFIPRVTVQDGASMADHATHVGGTIGAAGINLLALGMAPSVLIDSYEWTNDTGEMTSRAMATAGEIDKLQISSHSYGYLAGWYWGTYPPRWYGTWGDRESDSFGQYDSLAREWDVLCFDAPYFLPFVAAGNDRNDTAPSAGTAFQYYNNGWLTKYYDSATDPYSDNYDNGGFDTISLVGNAKNIMTIGAVNDAVANGIRSLPSATMSSFSCWGPTDDGRIKPDIVANGVSLTSCLSGSDTSYGSMSGTSMATPNASGSAVLLIQYFRELFPGQYPRASTLKGLIIHTADDIDNAGPDYRTGWGLMNVKAAADLIKAQHDLPSVPRLVEGLLTSNHTGDSFKIAWDGTNPIRATLCWTDPPADAVYGLDNPAIRLINDLDLRVIGPDNVSTYLPYVLDPNNPANTATNGDNIRDAVEQVYLAAPTPGTYTIQISHKGTLANGQQYYSLLISGAGAGPAGTIALTNDTYRCSSTVEVSLLDSDLRGQGTHQITVSTDSDTESVTVTEVINGTGIFSGTIAAASGTPVSQDGTLQVADGQTITATYQDADNGNGQPATVQDTADVDCVGPAVSNVTVTSITARSAVVSFTTNEPAQGRINYGPACGTLPNNRSDAGMAISHQITLPGLTPSTTHYFNVQATDAAGNTMTDDQGGSCYSLTTLEQPDYFTELYDSGNNDLDNRMILFTPNGSGNRYVACSEPTSAFPVSPTGSTPLVLKDDDYIEATLTGGAQIQLYGQAYSSFFIGSNGYITFGAGDDEYWESLTNHFSMPRISALFNDLNPTASGDISWKQLTDRAVVTFENIPLYGSAQGNSFQIELFFDGRIRITWLSLAATDGVAGLSAGLGLPVDFAASDLTAYSRCNALADFDRDGDVDLDDAAHLQLCLTGWGIAYTDPACQDADLNSDTYIEWLDSQLLLNCLSGADIPANPDCVP